MKSPYDLTNDGIVDAAAVETGSTANKIVKLDGSAKLPAVDGSALTSLNADNLSSGTVGTARLGSGSATSSTVLKGNSTWGAVTASLSTYDSGWFAASPTVAYSLTHGLGTTKALFTLYFADDNAGTGMFPVIMQQRNDGDNQTNASQIQDITTTTLTVQGGKTSVAVKLAASTGVIVQKASGYLRVIGLALA